MSSSREVLAKNLKENRKRMGITQSELAELAGISTNFLAMIELKHKFPGPETLDQLAKALNIEVNELFSVQSSTETELIKLHKAILLDLDRAITEAVNKAIKKP